MKLLKEIICFDMDVTGESRHMSLEFLVYKTLWIELMKSYRNQTYVSVSHTNITMRKSYNHITHHKLLKTVTIQKLLIYIAHHKSCITIANL